MNETDVANSCLPDLVNLPNIYVAYSYKTKFFVYSHILYSNWIAQTKLSLERSLHLKCFISFVWFFGSKKKLERKRKELNWNEKSRSFYQGAHHFRNYFCNYINFKQLLFSLHFLSKIFHKKSNFWINNAYNFNLKKSQLHC